MEKEKESPPIQAIFDNAPDAVIVIDDEGRVLNWNYKAEVTFGWKAHEVVGQFLHQFIIPPRYREAHVRGLERFRTYHAEGPVLHTTVEIEGLRRDGSEIDVSLSIAPARVNERQLFTGFVRDISEKRLSERALSSTEERFRLLVESVKDYAIFMLEPDGTVSSWNIGAQRLKGYAAEEIIGKHFSTFYPEEEKQRNHPAYELKKAIEDGRYEEEGWRVRKDGTRFWANVVITPLYARDGTLTGFAKVTRDMTERMQAARVLESSNRELERSNKELSAFSYAASHDLQEPLRKIQTFVGRIMAKEADRLTDSGRDSFNRITAAAERMQTLIDDLLSFSRVSNTFNEDLRDVDLNNVIGEIQKNHQSLSDDSQLTVVSDDLPTVRAAALQMRQLFGNLISNSVKYARPDVPLRIVIRSGEVTVPHPVTGERGKYHRIDITDNGIGFEQQYATRIFEMFHRLHSKNEYPGTGIGLAIVKKIVENHNGFVTAKGSPGEGATFSVFLPQVLDHVPAVSTAR